MDLVDTYKTMKFFLIFVACSVTFSVSADSKVYFINLEDGDRVESPFLIQFGLSNMGVAPAGTDRKNTGHHHLLINVNDIDLTKPIPSSSVVITTALISLSALQLLIKSVSPASGTYPTVFIPCFLKRRCASLVHGSVMIQNTPSKDRQSQILPKRCGFKKTRWYMTVQKNSVNYR